MKYQYKDSLKAFVATPKHKKTQQMSTFKSLFLKL